MLLCAGPFYFAKNTAGALTDMWFSEEETAKLVFMKTAIAKAFHQSAGEELLQKLFSGKVPLAHHYHP